MRLKGFVLVGFALLLTSCGQQHEAESLVEDFMKENLADASGLSVVDFGKLDSTRHVNDSAITAMRNVVAVSGKYKSDIKYEDAPDEKTLFMLRVEYCMYNDTCSDTYYLNRDISGVVAFKSNSHPVK